ncbi:MAG: undecaprenyl-diphosphate phosphatase [Candidatus Pacebacteria bacterium]|nr:undecaprenyl-diphosphate phosphatase [Candidatus Paceibacterota bacterium]PIR59598.1 MAG: hypothetical protein COU68_04710 [Candidatus Pacebacteria bacterium CG10_big_fil_rev_8_21_14_0_10_45_6]
MTIFQSLILGSVQGLTEFLPVSSSGHLILFESWFGIVQSGIIFEVILHAATLGAVFVFFFPALKRLTVSKIGLLLLATIPAAVVGVLFKSQIESMFDSVTLVACALLVTAGINLGISYYLKREQDRKLTWKSAIFIGVVQAFAITPGISRSGSTIFAGLKSGLARKAAFEFSFLLSIPAIGGAMLLQALDVVQAGAVLPPLTPMITGFVAAFLTGLASLLLLKKLLVTNHFSLFSWYTAGLAIVVLAIEFIY